jgi:hypothetical protein
MMGIPNKHKTNLSHFGKINYYRVITITIAVGLILLCLDNISYYGMQIFKWDLLLISGVIVFIVAVQMAFKIPAKFDEMLNRLAHRGVIQCTQKELEILKKKLQHSARKLAILMGIFFALSLFLSFFIAFGFNVLDSRTPIMLLEAGGGFIAGTFFGHMCAYGGLGRAIQKQHIQFRIRPMHPDDVGGLQPIGEFYFSQAMVVAIPAFFLAVWLLIMQFGSVRYAYWKTPYAVLLSINIIVEIFVFLAPLLSFHGMMIAQKQKQLEEADELSKEIELAEHQLSEEQDTDKRNLVKDRLSSMIKEYWAIESLPTWPISKKTRKLFKRNNFTLLIPLLIDIIGRTSIGKTSWWQDASGIFERMIK